ncbi:hypothetical protein LCGC14_0785910 [marine sediment metagenome]|uniref:Uncharacterized protein n=1 Tax=marine sediment metagenome TaxID=412755 RepID=A0A0F9PYD3_9ZZZZ
MTTDTPTRDELLAFPCPSRDLDSRCDDMCIVADVCDLAPVYRAHIKLRNDMRKLRAAVLGDMTPEKAAKL